MKKLTEIFLGFLTIFTLCMVISTSASAESFSKNVDDYAYVDYCKLGPGEISIVGYTGKAKNIKIRYLYI